MTLPSRLRLLGALSAVLLVGALAPDLALAQEQLPGSRVGSQNLRPYWHVFVAYAIVIVAIGAWAFSIARRLRSVEERLVD